MTEIQHQRRLRSIFNWHGMSGKAIALVLEHLPCCLLSVAAAAVGIPFLNHNTLLELGFAIGGAIAGEYIGHKYIFKKYCADHTAEPAARRYAIALAIGLTTWGAHQIFLHEPAERHASAHDHGHAIHQTVTASAAMPTSVPVRPQPPR